MPEPHPFETGEGRVPEPEAALGLPEDNPAEEVSDPGELKVRLAVKNHHIQELYEELAGARLSADEVRAVREVGQRSISALEEERNQLQQRVRDLEAELGRERDRREELEDALERQKVAAAELRAQLEEEYEERRRIAQPENRLRAGIELFNESEHRNAVTSLSRSMGQPEVHVALEAGEEPAVILNITWQGITWQTYSANPGLAVEEPRVYLKSSGEDLSGIERPSPNARVGPGGRVFLGV
ncbi:MAG: hypothetical protein ACFB50_17005 [Rubrobacteraceae bacterium]